MKRTQTLDTTAANHNPMLVKPAKLLLTARDLTEVTPLSMRSIWRHVADGTIPAPMRIGGRRVWSREVIEKWIAAGCPKTRNSLDR